MILTTTQKQAREHKEQQERAAAIQQAAYFKAEAAGFPAGQELRFFLEAEKDYDAKSSIGRWRNLLRNLGQTG